MPNQVEFGLNRSPSYPVSGHSAAVVIMSRAEAPPTGRELQCSTGLGCGGQKVVIYRLRSATSELDVNTGRLSCDDRTLI